MIRGNTYFIYFQEIKFKIDNLFIYVDLKNTLKSSFYNYNYIDH